MTRKKALNFLYKKIKSYSGKIETNKKLIDLARVDKLINQIYDDFENRTCGNCKYYKEEGSYCENEENEVFEFDNYKKMKIPDWKFGCNRFERKK